MADDAGASGPIAKTAGTVPPNHITSPAHERTTQPIRPHSAANTDRTAYAADLGLPPWHLAVHAAQLPLHAHMLAILCRGAPPARPAERLLPRYPAIAALSPLGRQRIRPRTVTGLSGNREAHALQPKRTVAARRAARSGHANRSVGKPIDETIRRISSAPMCRPKASTAACRVSPRTATGTLGHKAPALSGAGRF